MNQDISIIVTRIIFLRIFDYFPQLSLAPDISNAQESWEISKKKHAREVRRQQEEEEARLVGTRFST